MFGQELDDKRESTSRPMPQKSFHIRDNMHHVHGTACLPRSTRLGRSNIAPYRGRIKPSWTILGPTILTEKDAFVDFDNRTRLACGILFDLADVMSKRPDPRRSWSGGHTPNSIPQKRQQPELFGWHNSRYKSIQKRLQQRMHCEDTIFQKEKGVKHHRDGQNETIHHTRPTNQSIFCPFRSFLLVIRRIDMDSVQTCRLRLLVFLSTQSTQLFLTLSRYRPVLERPRRTPTNKIKPMASLADSCFFTTAGTIL